MFYNNTASLSYSDSERRTKNAPLVHDKWCIKVNRVPCLNAPLVGTLAESFRGQDILGLIHLNNVSLSVSPPGNRKAIPPGGLSTGIIIIIIIIYLPMSTIHEKKHNEYTAGKTYKAHRALTVALN